MVIPDKMNLEKYFNCDIKAMKCSNILDYIKKQKSIGTSLIIENKPVSLYADGTLKLESEDVLFDSMPMIVKILKSSINY